MVARRGIGAAERCSLRSTVDPDCWEASGIWKSASASRFYGWRPRCCMPLGSGGDRRSRLPRSRYAPGRSAFSSRSLARRDAARVRQRRDLADDTYTRWIDALFAPSALPTIIPRLVLFALLVQPGS